MTRVQRIQHLQKIVGAATDGVIGNETLSKFKTRFKVPSKAMVAHFFGNVHHESGGFSISEESGMYSAQRLLQVFPKYFKSIAEAQQFANKPEAIFNRTYGGRMGNDMPGDGWKYRGRGAIQTTGKWSYDRLGKFVGSDLVNNPDLVSTEYYWESAIFYFNDRKLWNLTSDVSEPSIQLIRRRINGGLNGLDDTRKWVNHYFNLMK